MGFSQNLDWEMGIGSPLQGPLSTLTSFNEDCSLQSLLIVQSLKLLTTITIFISCGFAATRLIDIIKQKIQLMFLHTKAYWLIYETLSLETSRNVYVVHYHDKLEMSLIPGTSSGHMPRLGTFMNYNIEACKLNDVLSTLPFRSNPRPLHMINATYSIFPLRKRLVDCDHDITQSLKLLFHSSQKPTRKIKLAASAFKYSD